MPTSTTSAFAIRVLIGAGVVLALLLFVALLWYAVDALLLTFAAVLLAIILRSVSDWLEAHTRLSDRWALAVVVIALLLILGIFTALAAPQIIEQAGQLQARLPEAIGAVYAVLREHPWGRWLLDLLPTQAEFEATGGLGGEVFWRATGLAYTAAQVFFGIVILIFVTLYLAVDPRLYINGLLHLVPVAYRPRAAEVLAATGATLRWWLFGTLVKMAVVGLVTFLGLWGLDVPLAMLLALLAGLLDFVPYVGPIIAAIPAVLIGFTGGLEQALWVTLLYLVVQQIEGLIISPVIYHRTVYLAPALTILAEIILFAMAGAIGLILATPLVTLAVVLVKMLYVEQVLGDTGIPRPEAQLPKGSRLSYPTPDRKPPGPDRDKDT